MSNHKAAKSISGAVRHKPLSSKAECYCDHVNDPAQFFLKLGAAYRHTQHKPSPKSVWSVIMRGQNKQKEPDVKELVDYSGNFDPHFSYEKFTKETILKLLKAYSEYMLRIDAFWYLTVMNKLGNDEALDCDIKVWEKAKLWEMQTISSILNVHGDDVATLMKYLQVTPWGPNYGRNIDLKNSNHAVLTMNFCPNLLSIEKEGTGREKQLCHEVEPRVWGIMAHFFNPKIQVIPLKLPPRTDYSDCCCQWEFKIDR